MKKKWIVIPSVAVLGVIAALIIGPDWQRLRDQVIPPPKIAVDRAMRTAAIDQLVARLEAHYVFPDKAREMAALLRQRERDHSYDGISDGRQLAAQLSADLASISHDLHLGVEFDPHQVPPDLALGPPPRTKAQFEQRTRVARRAYLAVFSTFSSLGVDKVERLPDNIGYLRVTSFPPPFFVDKKYAAAMDQLADTDGLIIDLRENHGGSPQAVALLVSYFVDRRTRLNDIWDRDSGISEQQWTDDKLDGKRYGGSKPVMLLAGRGTASAGEDFAYTMQALKRATVIGARTWGGAHPTRPFRLGDHFYAVIPTGRSISPITHSNWEGTGVLPDIAAPPEQALALAKERLQRQLHGAAAVVARAAGQ